MSNKVIIVTDTTCDLSEEIIKEHDIKIIPLHVIYGETVYDDGVNITPDEIYKKVDELGILPKTSANTPSDFHYFCKPYLEQGYDIWYTGISGQMSGSLQNFLIEAQNHPEGRMVASDSGNLSTGIGLLVLKACEYRDKGLSALQIKAKIDYMVPHVKVQFVINSLDYLYKGGRCTSMSKVFGTLLRIHPMIVVRDGKMVVGKKIIGKLTKSVNVMTDIFLNDFPSIDPSTVFITDSWQADDLYEQIYNRMKENGCVDKIKNIYHTHAGCCVSSHCGPRTIGILYIMKKGLNDTDLDEDAFE